MTPLELLKEECASVRRTLDETLRYDYGADASREYYQECKQRLERIERAVPNALPTEVWALRGQLVDLTGWISLIERSRLGEFSWPFAEGLRAIARPLLVEDDPLGKPIFPIVNIIAEGEGYQIVYEGKLSVPSPTTGQNFAIVAFPRQFRYHVLLHTIFGHELGHAAQGTNAAGRFISANAIKPLTASGLLASNAALDSWINAPSAPIELKTEIASYGGAPAFEDYFREAWINELICDLFGLMIFGPGFLAAHRLLLESAHRTPYEFDFDYPSHPPFAIRHRTLVQAMRILGWDKPITTPALKEVHEAEAATLQYLVADAYSPWATIVDDSILKGVLQALQSSLANYGGFGYVQPSAALLSKLVRRMVRRLPPTDNELSVDGTPILTQTMMAHTLYAGWVYWLGRPKLVATPAEAMSFLEANRLCDQALLQERAISIALNPKRV